MIEAACSRSQQAIEPRQAELLITRFKNGSIDNPPPWLSRLVETYNDALADAELLDFDDLIVKAIDYARPIYAYILVDEFQDTNYRQYRLVRKLLATNNLTVIGDPMQSIYGFRGAGSDIFETFKTDFLDCVEVRLAKNYRSSPEIVALITKLDEGSMLSPATSDPGRVEMIEAPDEFAEADWTVDAIASGIGGIDLNSAAPTDLEIGFDSVAVIYRSHHQARLIERRLHTSGIPFQMVGDKSPYESPIMLTLEALIRAKWTGDPDLVDQAVRSLGISSDRIRLAQDRLGSFNLTDFIRDLGDLLGLGSELRRPSLMQTLSNLTAFDRGEAGYLDFIAHLDRLRRLGFYDETAARVTLSTIHAAKGLEFDWVILVGFEEGALPKSGADPAEERRLAYVAISRPRRRLSLTYARARGRRPAMVSSLAEMMGLQPTIDSNVTRRQRSRHRRNLRARQTRLF
jgi:superfamily I DNA/RNA helicase